MATLRRRGRHISAAAVSACSSVGGFSRLALSIQPSNLPMDLTMSVLLVWRTGHVGCTCSQVSVAFAGDHIHTAGQARQLVWNRGAGLQRDSAILQNATRARVFVDPQGRRSVNMTVLGAVAGTARGDQNYR